jgi:hypothetical protein
VPDDLTGRKFRCGKCGVVVIPTEGGAFVTEPTPLPSAPTPSRTEEGLTPRRDEGNLPRPPRWEDEVVEDWPPLRQFLRGQPEALARVRGPGTLLQVYGVLLAIAGAALPVLAVFTGDPVAFALCVAGCALCMTIGGFTYLGGTRMKALRSYGLALAAVVLTFVVAVLACVPLVVVGIWPLAVLMDGRVKESFDRFEGPVE